MTEEPTLIQRVGSLGSVEPFAIRTITREAGLMTCLSAVSGVARKPGKRQIASCLTPGSCLLRPG